MEYSNKTENIFIQKSVLIVGIILFLFKIYAWYLTDSISILTDALESIVNIISAIVGLISLYISNLPKDLNHPNGHGKVEFVSSGIEGTLITLTGFIIIYNSVIRFIFNSEIGKLDYGIILILITAIVNYIFGSISIKCGKKNNSIALISGGEHLKTDTYSSIGILIGLILIYITNLQFLDCFIALIYGFLIIATGYKIIRTSVAGVMDESNVKIINKIELILLKNKRRMTFIKDIKVINYGNILHIDCTLVILEKYTSVEDIINEIKSIKSKIQLQFKEEIDLFIQLKNN